MLRVNGIFTAISISLRTTLRQRPDRYAIRAGRNLPDKEFRYLRTVIVTAAVYRGFDSKLSPLLLTFRHRAGVRPYTSSRDFAEPCVFNKQSPPPGLCHPLLVAQKEVPLLPKLRGHFAEFLHHDSLDRLGILYLSTSVGLGYGRTRHLAHEAFLDSTGSLTHPQPWAPHHASTFTPSGFTYQTVHTLSPGQPSPGMSYLTASLRSLPTT